MDRKQILIIAVVSGTLILLAATVAAAWTPTQSTPLYTYRMEQSSSHMNFLPTERNVFTYNTEKGCMLNPIPEKYCGNVTPDADTSIGTCFGHTCLISCAGYTCGGSTCSVSCDNWTCYGGTCYVSCDVFTCHAPNTCQNTCPYTCWNTCSTCYGWTCSPTGCQQTCWTCEATSCQSTCEATCEWTCESSTCSPKCVP
jgi:hypothetical protein